MIEMELFELRLDESGADQIVILKEKDGNRILPIMIGYYEAQSIHLALNDIHIQRPLTHDLLVNIIYALDADIRYVIVNDLRETTFYARIHFNINGQDVDVDARPSDAVAVAVRSNSTIYVEDSVLDAAGKE